MEFSIKNLDLETWTKILDNLVHELELLRKAVETIAVEMVYEHEA